MLSPRTLITFEKLERSFYRLPDSERILATCEECGGEVSWLTPWKALSV